MSQKEGVNLQLKVDEFIKAVSGTPMNLNFSGVISGISIDSRTIKQGEAFFALKGENFDGHDFVEEALKKGQTIACVSKSMNLPNLILVKDTLIALQNLAKYYRKKIKIKCIGITGSNGKTTTKEMTARVLSTKYKVLACEKSFNNQIGVPLTVTKIDQHEIGVFELGMNHPGEIKRLAEIVLPEIGVITNIQPVHIGYFNSLSDILEAKLELREFVDLLVVNGDDPYLKRLDIDKKLIFFGLKNGNLKPSKIEFVDDGIIFTCDGVKCKLNILSKHTIYNALAAITIGKLFGIDIKDACLSLDGFTPLPGRGQIINIRDIKLIDSSYNSNPYAVIGELEGMQHLPGRKIVVLGDMLELGDKSKVWHEFIGKNLKRFGIEILIAYGTLARYFFESANVQEKYYFNLDDFESLLNCVISILQPGDTVLVKGSRRVQLDRLVNEIKSMEG